MPPKLDAMDFQNKIIKKVVSENRESTDEIHHLTNMPNMTNMTNTRHQIEAATINILARIYKNMVFFGNNLEKNSTSGGRSDQLFDQLFGQLLKGSEQIIEQNIFNAWRSFFDPIRALMKLPSGDFVAARMFLYLASVFIFKPGVATYTVSEESAPLYELCTELDDALLEPLRRTWIASSNCEFYDWVFTEYHIQGLSEIDNGVDQEAKWLKLAQALSHKELIELGGINGERFYYTDRYNGKDYELYTEPMPRWDCDEVDGGIKAEWKASGSDGPIRGEILYRATIRDNSQDRRQREISVLRRSRQFCFDARQIAEATIGKQGHQLLNTICRRHGIPPELQLEILSYLKYREPFSYLHKLDIAAAYLPFPKVGERCLSCESCEIDSTLKRTCPHSSLYIWNLALRRFHVFHKNSFRAWALCAHNDDCPGHHESDNWAVTRDPEFTLYLDALAAKGNDEFISLDQVGLGPVEQIRLGTWDEDQLRQDRLFSGIGVYRDSMDDLLMVGGLRWLKGLYAP